MKETHCQLTIDYMNRMYPCPSPDPPHEEKRLAVSVGIMGVTLGCGIALAIALSFLPPSRKGGASVDAKKETANPSAPPPTAKTPSATPPPPPIGLGIGELGLTSVPISGHWKEADILADDQQDWTGSTCVIGETDGYIILITNFHCLGLDALYAADDDGSPEVIEYSLNLHFPDGATRAVERFGVLDGDLDIAWLAVKAEDLRFVALGKPIKLPGKNPGFNVAVVGSPMGLAFEGTYTFGKISAIRSAPDSLGKEVQYIQTDAAINHGNSGGPLFIQVGEERYLWAGVAVARVDAADNLGMAISAESLLERDSPHWFSANVSGVVELFTPSR